MFLRQTLPHVFRESSFRLLHEIFQLFPQNPVIFLPWHLWWVFNILWALRCFFWLLNVFFVSSVFSGVFSTSVGSPPFPLALQCFLRSFSVSFDSSPFLLIHSCFFGGIFSISVGFSTFLKAPQRFLWLFTVSIDSSENSLGFLARLLGRFAQN